MIPAGIDVKSVVPDLKQPVSNEENHVQEITALQPPPSEVLTLKAGVLLNENGHILNGPEPAYENKMSLEKYYNTLGSQTMQRKKFHEQRLKSIETKQKTGHKTHLEVGASHQNNKNSMSKQANTNSRKGILKSQMNNNLSGTSFYQSERKDQIMIHKDLQEWKEDLILEQINNPKRSDSKYSAILNDSYQTAINNSFLSRDKSSSQNSFQGINSKTVGERPNSSFNNYGYDSDNSARKNQSVYNTANKLKTRSGSIHSKGRRRMLNSSGFDYVMNYKSKMFKESMPVYGAFDAFNRMVLKNAHEESGSGGLPRTKEAALRPKSKKSNNMSVGIPNIISSNNYQESQLSQNKTFYPSLMKKPRERVKEEVKNLIMFRRTFYHSPNSREIQ